MMPTYNQLLSQNEQLEAQAAEYKQMLIEWQNWWNEHGSEWYMYGWCDIDAFEHFHGPVVKPPFLRADHPMHNQWVQK